ncbi:hypothetical protein Hanom_Chr01g00004511 [Helianthus anomalus]
MSSERCNSNKSCLICSSHVSLGPPLPLLPSTTTLTGAVVCLRFTCPNHRNLPSLILSDILATPNLSLKTSFLICSSHVSLVQPLYGIQNSGQIAVFSTTNSRTAISDRYVIRCPLTAIAVL